MVKQRNAYYCNLKLGLIFLVIVGHWIEPTIWSDPERYRFYRLIYLFHMPLFVFLSGLFLRDSQGCIRQLRRMLPIYLICQTIAVALGQTRWHTPWWILWYLLSLCCWLGISALLLRLRRGRWTILFLSFALACLAGQVPWIGRPFSFSRTIVFFPWFWLGILLPPDIPWHRLRIPAALGLLLIRPQMSAAPLWQAGPCSPAVRLTCYAYGLLLGLAALSFCPSRRFPWSRAGADTLPAFLLHGPIVFLLRPTPYCIPATILFLYLTHKATQWRSTYGIIGKEDAPWPDLMTSTYPRASRSTGSSSR